MRRFGRASAVGAGLSTRIDATTNSIFASNHGHGLELIFVEVGDQTGTSDEIK